LAKSTYTAVGNAEDISDIITNISPKVTPFYSACGRTRATATNHEWLEDSLRDPAQNKKIEGFEYVAAAPVPRVRLGNFTQILSVGYWVTDTQEVVLKHGLNSEIGYQMVKASREMARDVENALISQASKDAGSDTAARQFGGVPFWIKTNAVTGGTGDPLSEDMMNQALQMCWAKGGDPTKVFLSGDNKRAVSAWSGEGDKYLDQNSKKLVSSIAVYESDFGIVSFIPHRMMPENKVFVIDQNYWKIAALRPMRTSKLPKTGDKQSRVIVGELTLEARAEKASAVITLKPA
jgi:hypothetical protein